MLTGYKRRADQNKSVYETPFPHAGRIAKNLAFSSGDGILLGDRVRSGWRWWLSVVFIGLAPCIASVAEAAPTVSDDSDWSPSAQLAQLAQLEGSMIARLSKRVWDDRGLRRARLQQIGSLTVFERIGRAMRSMMAGDDQAALELLGGAVRLARLHSHRQTTMIDTLLGQLAEKHIAAGDFASASAVYREMLRLGPYLPVGYTSVALNRLIGTHFEMGDYEAALMYVRVGIAVLDDVGMGPYLAMNRIIEEMATLEDPIADLEYDFDAAMSRLTAAAEEAAKQGLVIEEQWWAPVYFARDDREQAIELLKGLVRPDLADTLREAAREEPVPVDAISP